MSVASFANIFSYSEGCLFILFTVSFAVQKLLNLIRSHLFIFVFISIIMGDKLKKDIVAILVINKMKRKPTEWHKIFAKDVTNKGLIWISLKN